MLIHADCVSCIRGSNREPTYHFLGKCFAATQARSLKLWSSPHRSCGINEDKTTGLFMVCNNY